MFAELVDGHIVVQTRWDEKDLIRQVPGARWNSDERHWVLRLSWAACIQLRGVFQQQLQVGPALASWSWNEYEMRVKPALAWRELLSVEFTPDPRNDHDERLYDFQIPGREFLVIGTDVVLGDDMGTGKTVQAMAALRRLILLYGLEYTLPGLVVCPNSTKRTVWEKEIRDWLPEATPYVIAGTPKVKQELLDEAKGDPSSIVIVNIEAALLFSRLAPYGSVALKRCRECDRHGDPNLKPTRCEVHRKPLNGFGFKTAIIDEAHRIKQPEAKQTRAIWAAFHDPSILRRWALSGTIASRLDELWSIMHGIAPWEFPTKGVFIDRYGLFGWNVNGELDLLGIRPDTGPELFKFFDARFRRMTKDLVLPQLPPKVRSVRMVQMTPKQAKAYKEIAKSAVTRLDDGSLLVAKSDLGGATRLLQLSSSYATIDKPDPEDSRTWQVELCDPSPKIDELVAIIAEHGERPLAVVAEHRRLIELAVARLDKLHIPSVQITGGVPEAARPLNLQLFNRGGVNIILFTYKAGGVGIDMSHAGTLVRLQRTWSLVDNVQGEDRVHRIGSEQHKSIQIIDVVAEDTIELDQIERLLVKMKRLEEIVRDRKRRINAGMSVSDLDQERASIMDSWLGDPT